MAVVFAYLGLKKSVLLQLILGTSALNFKVACFCCTLYLKQICIFKEPFTEHLEATELKHFFAEVSKTSCGSVP